jgi:hypothetical protein
VGSYGKVKFVIENSNYIHIKFTQEIKSKIVRGWRGTRQEFMINRTTFPEIFPAIYQLKVTPDRIYVFTFKEKNGRNECLAYNMKGRLVDIFYLPLMKLAVENSHKVIPHLFHNGKFYKLQFNENEENWELFSQKLDQKF